MTVARVRPDWTGQDVATGFLLQEQLYVYERPVWRLFLKKEVNESLLNLLFTTGVLEAYSRKIFLSIYIESNRSFEEYTSGDFLIYSFVPI